MNTVIVRKKNRLIKYDYSQSGWYFVTICTNHMRQWFGEVKDRKMILNISGKVVEMYWLKISKHFPSVDIDEFIIMPNHIHGIVIIRNVGAGFSRPKLGQIVGYFKYQTTKQINKLMNETENLFSAELGREMPKGLGRETRPLQIIKLQKIWQRSFYDHIIRNEKSLNSIRRYIKFNAHKWEDDEYYL